MQLAETYRPRSLDAVIGQPKTIAAMKRLAAQGFGGRAYLFAGKSGLGKNSIINVATRMHTDDMHTLASVGRKFTVKTLEDWLDSSRYACKWAFVIDEIHTMRGEMIERLLPVIDSGCIPSNVTWWFTTTWDGQARMFEDHADAHPFQSRCLTFRLTNQGVSDLFAAKAQEVARAEGLDGKPIKAYKQLIADCDQSLREAYSRIEAGAMLE